MRATDFILLVDGRKVDLIRSQMTDEGSTQGSVSVPITEIGTSTDKHRHRSTVTYTTTQTRGYDAYQATYRLAFPFFDDQGLPYVTRSVRKIRLRIIMPKGVCDVEIDLKRLAKKIL